MHDALAVLNALHPAHPTSDDFTVDTVPAAVSCIAACHSSSEKLVLTYALLRALPMPHRCADLSETLSEIIGNSGTSPHLLRTIYQVVLQLHDSVSPAQIDSPTIRHVSDEIASEI